MTCPASRGLLMGSDKKKNLKCILFILMNSLNNIVVDPQYMNILLECKM